MALVASLTMRDAASLTPGRAAAEPRPLAFVATQILTGCSEELEQLIQSKLHTAVRIEIGSTAALVERLQGGYVADVALLTQDALEELASKGLIEPPRNLAISELGIAVSNASAPPELGSADALVSYLKSVPSIAISLQGSSGAHVLKLLDRYDIADSVKPKIVSIKAGLTGTLVTQGIVVAAIQQMSELKAAGLQKIVQLPQEAQLRTVVSGAVLRRSSDIERAREALSILTLPEAAAVYTRAALQRTPDR